MCFAVTENTETENVDSFESSPKRGEIGFCFSSSTCLVYVQKQVMTYIFVCVYYQPKLMLLPINLLSVDLTSVNT